MRTRLSIFLSSFFILLFFPFLCTFVFHGAQACTLLQPAKAEKFLPYLLSLQIDDNKSSEALKTQAVIARSNLNYQQSQGKSLLEILKTQFSDILSSPSWYRIFFISDSYQNATESTSGQILTFENTPCLTPYHEVSCGKTRSGEEVFHNSAFSYLKSVDSSQDLEAPNYFTTQDIASQQFPSSLEIQKTDSSGYVLTLNADDTTFSGEYFRHEFGLASSCFSIQKNGDNLRFLCKGQGDGVGLSQYGAEIMAEDGSTYDEILLWYFPSLMLTTTDF